MLTADGRELLAAGRAGRGGDARASSAGATRAPPGARCGSRPAPGPAGSWPQHIAEIVEPGDAFRLQLLSAEARLDIGRRAADIGLRNRRPEEAWLAGQRLGRVAYAVYGRRRPAPEGFVGGDRRDHAVGAVAAGAARGAVAVEVSNPRLVLDLVLAGAGRAVLPCFVGDAEPRLVRLGPPIAELAHEQWLVMHHEDRHDPAVRTVARRIARLVRAHRAASSALRAGAEAGRARCREISRAGALAGSRGCRHGAHQTVRRAAAAAAAERRSRVEEDGSR